MSGAAGGRPNVGVIGSGAIAESFHLPALVACRDRIGELILVDPSLDHAKRLSEQFSADDVAESHLDVLDRVSAVVVTAPHQYHYPIARDCLAKGIHVLIEKPLAESADQAAELVTLADEHGAVLATNNTRRLIPACIEVKRLLEEGAIGPLRNIDFFEGDLFGWPLASGAVFRSDRGVLLDVGAHLVDLVCWWMGGRPEVIDFHDDSFGGPEAVAHLRLALGSITANVRLSWLTKQENTAVLEGERGRIEWSIYDWNAVTLTQNGREKRITARVRIDDYQNLARPLIERFLSAGADGTEPAVAGRDVVDSIGVMEDAYANRTRFDMPWLQEVGA